MRVLYIILFFWIIVSKSSNAQVVTWQREYPSYPESEGTSVSKLFDGGFIFCGQSILNKYVVIRTNIQGEPIWTRSFEGLFPSKIIQTTDSGFVIVGISEDRIGLTTDSYILKLNQFGDSLWSRKYGLEFDQDKITDLIEMQSVNLLMLGWSRFSNSVVKMFLLKTNSTGDSLFMTYYDNTGGSALMSKFYDSKLLLTGSTALITDTNGFKYLFTNEYFGKGISFRSNFLFVKNINVSDSRVLKITKTNENFKIIDTNYISIPNKLLYEQNLTEFEKGILSCGFAINNITGEAGGYIAGIDSNCNLIWYKDYFLSERNLKFEGLSVCNDKGFIAIGDNYRLSNGTSYITATKTDSLGKTILLRTNFQSTITSKDYILYQNFPNPFNPITKISFSVSTGGFVTLKVYDITGREMKRLADGYLQSGRYEVEFKGKDFPSGVYYYTMEAGDFRETKRMILIK